MKDELDFDVQTLRYVNIGRSKHRGIEVGIRMNALRYGSAFANYTLQRVTAEMSYATVASATRLTPSRVANRSVASVQPVQPAPPFHGFDPVYCA
jgi:outer membrane receptor protein involved in Fe transport